MSTMHNIHTCNMEHMYTHIKHNVYAVATLEIVYRGRPTYIVKLNK